MNQEHPYRELTHSQPSLTYVEKLFLSHKLHHRVLGHTLLIAEPVLQVIVVFLIIFLIGAATLLLGWGAWIGLTWLAGKIGAFYIFVVFASLALLARILTAIIEEVKSNTKEMNLRLKKKFEQAQRTEEDNEI